MNKIHEIIADHDNDRFYRMDHSSIEAFSVTQEDRLWITGRDIDFRELFGFALHNGFIYAADEKNVYKISAENGELEKEVSNGQFIAQDNPKMALVNERLVIIDSNGSYGVYGLNELEHEINVAPFMYR